MVQNVEQVKIFYNSNFDRVEEEVNQWLASMGGITIKERSTFVERMYNGQACMFTVIHYMP